MPRSYLQLVIQYSDPELRGIIHIIQPLSPYYAVKSKSE